MTGKDPQNGRSETSEPASGGDLSGRLERLGTRLEAKLPASRPAAQRSAPSSDPTALAKALRASSEFVAGVIVGGGIGWVLDRSLGTSPWGLIVFLMLGFAAGVLNVLRSAGATTGPGR